MFNDELFQKIARTPGLTSAQLAEYFNSNLNTIRGRLYRLGKYGVLTTTRVPNPKPTGVSTVKAYYPSDEGLKYVKKEDE